MSAVATISAGRMSLRIRRRSVVITAGALIVLVFAMLASLSLGSFAVTPWRAVVAVFGHGTPAEELIVAQLRLPRVLAGAMVGVALGAAGAIFQSVSRNPLGSPDVIGFDTGAATGALVAMLVLHGGVVATSVGAVLGGGVTAALVYLLASRDGVAPLRLVLVGIGGGALLSALNSMLIVRAQVYDAQSASVWLVGNLAGRGWANVSLLGPLVIVGLILAGLLTRALTLGEFSDERSATLGMHPGRMRLAAVAVGVLLASGAVATAGPILFVALAAPQVARRINGSAGPNLAASALTGGAMLVLADLAAREAFQPRQLPVGVLTGVVGGSYLAWLLAREWRKGRS